MSEISTFYLFVTKNGGFDKFKRDADTNNNETIQFNELYNYIESKTELKDISADGRYNIWRDLDVFINGSNENSTNGVSEDGSLNLNEEDRFEFRIEVYGMMSAKIGNVIGEITGNSAFSEYQLNENSLEAAIIDEILAHCNNNIERVPDYLKTSQATNDIRKYAIQGALFMVADQIYENMGSYIQGYENYNFENDNDLKSLISGYIGTQNTTQGDLGAVINNITNIVGKYLQTAGLASGQTYNAPNGYEYEGKMNTLQLAVLEKNWRNAIAADPNAEEYEGFAAELYENAINTFIGRQVAEWEDAPSSDFSTYNISAGDIQDAFRASDEMNLLSQVVELGGIEDDVAGYDGEWSDFYGEGTQSPGAELGENDPRRMASLLFYFCGMNIFSNSEFAEMFAEGENGADSVYMKYLKLAFTDILNNLEAYGIENASECEQQDLQNAILKFFKNNLRDILTDMGKTDESTIINALYMNLYGTYDIIHNKKTEAYGDYGIKDLVNQAKALVSFAELKFGVPASVIKDCGLDGLNDINDSNIDTVDADELIEGIRELMEYLRTEVDEYHRIDPVQAEALYSDENINAWLADKGITDETKGWQAARTWLHNIAERCLETFTGYSISAFEAYLNNEWENWFNDPINAMLQGINNLGSHKDLSETSSLTELRQALVDMIDYASQLGIELIDTNGSPLTAASVGNTYGDNESDLARLYQLIQNIKDLLLGIDCDNMQELAEKYENGKIQIYVLDSSFTNINLNDVDIDEGIPDGTTNFNSLGNARARIGRHLGPRIYERLTSFFNRLKIPQADWNSAVMGSGSYDSNGNTTLFEQCLRNAVDNHWHWDSIFHISYVVSCEEAASECVSNMTTRVNEWTTQYLADHTVSLKQ